MPFGGKTAREARGQIENEREWVGGRENWENEREGEGVGEGGGEGKEEGTSAPHRCVSVVNYVLIRPHTLVAYYCMRPTSV